jgi:hypothetical protein
MAMTEFHKNRKSPLTEATDINLNHFIGFDGRAIASASLVLAIRPPFRVDAAIILIFCRRHQVQTMRGVTHVILVRVILRNCHDHSGGLEDSVTGRSDRMSG